MVIRVCMEKIAVKSIHTHHFSVTLLLCLNNSLPEQDKETTEPELHVILEERRKDVITALSCM